MLLAARMATGTNATTHKTALRCAEADTSLTGSTPLSDRAKSPF